jgi:hypothetical protein
VVWMESIGGNAIVNITLDPIIQSKYFTHRPMSVNHLSSGSSTFLWKISSSLMRRFSGTQIVRNWRNDCTWENVILIKAVRRIICYHNLV